MPTLLVLGGAHGKKQYRFLANVVGPPLIPSIKGLRTICNMNVPYSLLLILFSDHGFVENKAFSRTDKYEAPRYMHGKDSPFEVIIPWAWVMRL